MNGIPSMATTNQQPFNSIEKDNTTQKGTSLIQNANIRTLINDLTYNLVRIKQPPKHINDYFDKIEKQLSNSDSKVSSIPPVIQLSQPSSLTVITISEP
ncbi:unnamed protein product [Rotaria sp. Silwood2]|nr:unnamed protein product [Rotaria sp. Silwood2]CAF3316754.1 unnamed protein product [Rotaria sp. Silwood2]CAF4238583.1 unnamed protein product [Rotaria sp. Silwood2]CAF4466279.1 unnamed protein product [Rotaria sp. Silwood2]